MRANPYQSWNRATPFNGHGTASCYGWDLTEYPLVVVRNRAPLFLRGFMLCFVGGVVLMT
jgi:hypothetical protein